MDRVRSLIRYSCADLHALSGRGVIVAVLDSGVAPHPDLNGRTVLFRDFTKRARIGAYDDCGHGTHISGIISGNGSMSNGRYRGIAPQCSLIHAKILNAKGEGDGEAMLRALEWIEKLRSKIDIRILNLSIAVYHMDDMKKLRDIYRMLEELSDTGILIVTAAGNLGPDYGTISEIARSCRVLTVGCHDFGYKDKWGRSCDMHSGRGEFASEIRKPDLVAPGTEIHSCCHRPYGRAWRNWGYTAKTGTSMSVPIVSGAAALLIEQQPQLCAYAVKRKLQLGTSDLHEPYAKQGYGMLNLEKVLEKSG